MAEEHVFTFFYFTTAVVIIRLNNLLSKPNASKVQNDNEKTLALKIMSLDLNSIEQKKWFIQNHILIFLDLS